MFPTFAILVLLGTVLAFRALYRRQQRRQTVIGRMRALGVPEQIIYGAP